MIIDYPKYFSIFSETALDNRLSARNNVFQKLLWNNRLSLMIIDYLW